MSIVDFISWQPYAATEFPIEWEQYKFTLPLYGCLTAIEQEQYSRIALASYNDNNLPYDNYKMQIAAALLKLRLKKPNIPDSKVLLLPDESPMPFPLVEKIFDFFEAEANRRNPKDPKPEKEMEAKKTEADDSASSTTLKSLKSSPKEQIGEQSISS